MAVIVVVQSPSCVRIFVASWTAAAQASMSLTISQSLLKFMSIASAMLSITDGHQPSHPLMSSSSSVLNLSEHQGFLQWVIFFASDDQNTRVSASLSVLPGNIQCWSPLRLTDLISLLSKEHSGVFTSNTVWRHQFFNILPSFQSSFHNCIWPLERLDHLN